MKIIAVIGNGDESHIPETAKLIAHALGEEIAKSGCALICGGMDGIMKAACRGAKSQNGLTIGILPGVDVNLANQYVDVPICTGMAIGMRDNLIIYSASAVIVIGGGAGTLGEIALAYMYKKPLIIVAGTGGWAGKLDGEFLDERKKMKVLTASSAEEAVKKALALMEFPGAITEAAGS
jgi:uncharacterized protein (TIGR00725 family)